MARPLGEVEAFGAVYTPPSITHFLAGWAIQSADDKVLEPAAGDGGFLRAALGRLRDLGALRPERQLFAVELRPAEAEKARTAADGAQVRIGNFFEFAASDFPPVTAILGNPPFIRSHRFTGPTRVLGQARAMDQGVVVSALASSWAHFVVHSTSFLDPARGRLALVLPSELLHADYAADVRAFLLERFTSVTVITFDERAFEPAHVDAVLVLADREGPAGFHFRRLRSAEDLGADAIPSVPESSAVPDRWWNGLHHRSARLYATLAESDRFARLGTFASVDIGVVTGANHFFILTEKARRELSLPKRAMQPVVVRGRDISGLEVQSSETSWLLKPPDSTWKRLHPAVRAYVDEGVLAGVNGGYKCGHRDPWWNVPLPRHKGDLLLAYMHYGSPRLFANPLGTWSTNLIHAVRRLPDAPSARTLAAASLSAATQLSAEIEGRAYGGGVLKLETKEAERLLIPRLSEVEAEQLESMFETLNEAVLGGEADRASRTVDEFLGIDHEACVAARDEWRTRRQGLARGRRALTNTAGVRRRHQLKILGQRDPRLSPGGLIADIASGRPAAEVSPFT